LRQVLINMETQAMDSTLSEYTSVELKSCISSTTCTLERYLAL
jgi:hypothetical protein